MAVDCASVLTTVPVPRQKAVSRWLHTALTCSTGQHILHGVCVAGLARQHQRRLPRLGFVVDGRGLPWQRLPQLGPPLAVLVEHLQHLETQHHEGDGRVAEKTDVIMSSRQGQCRSIHACRMVHPWPCLLSTSSVLRAALGWVGWGMLLMPQMQCLQRGRRRRDPVRLACLEGRDSQQSSRPWLLFLREERERCVVQSAVRQSDRVTDGLQACGPSILQSLVAAVGQHGAPSAGSEAC